MKLIFMDGAGIQPRVNQVCKYPTSKDTHMQVLLVILKARSWHNPGAIGHALHTVELVINQVLPANVFPC